MIPIERVFDLAGASVAYYFGRTTAARTPAGGRWEASPIDWARVPAVQSAGGLAAMGFVSARANAARALDDVGVSGAAERSIQFAYRASEALPALWSFGAVGLNASDSFQVLASGDGRWVHGENDVTIPGAGAAPAGAWRHVALRAGRDGRCRAAVDGVPVIDTVFPRGALATARGPLRVLETVAGVVAAGADLSFIAIWQRQLTDDELADHRAALVDPHRLAGVAVLPSGAPATQVRVRRASDYEHYAVVVPDEAGAWAVPVPPGDYEVVIVGPPGFAPQVFTQVAAARA